MFVRIPKKYCIKIPDNVRVFYCNKKESITLKGPSLQQKSLKLKVKLLILSNKKIIKITPFPFTKVSNNKTRLMKTIQGTTCALIKQSLVEIVTTLYKKLKLVGVGYRLIPVESFEKRLILLRLGFSHLLYFRIPRYLNFFDKKRVQLFISGYSYQLVTKFASIIRSLKKPEVYKGKGILYENEKIILKEGKKI